MDNLSISKAIIDNIENPIQLENLYRKNKSLFESAFNHNYAQISHHISAQIWYERINYTQPTQIGINKIDIVFILIGSCLGGVIAKLPQILGLIEDEFYAKNFSFIVLPLLISYFSWKNLLSIKKTVTLMIMIVISAIYINSLQPISTNSLVILSSIHLPIFIWSILGYAFIGGDISNNHLKINYLKFNGDMLVICVLLVLAGALFSGITIGLFNLIDGKFIEFYMNYIVIGGLVSIPLIGSYLVQNNPSIVNRISPIIAKIFAPLVLITVIVFLFMLILSRKDIYTDRDFLLIFNVLLIGVMAIILFSVTEAAKNESNKFTSIILLSLAILTVIVNGIALSAIVFRLSAWGISPNRIAVLGANMLIFINIILVAVKLYKSIKERKSIEKVAVVIAYFIPYYSGWAFIVSFIFPLFFQNK